MMASTAVMGSGTAVDLALLGLLVERPRPADELIGAVKAVGGDRFTPTAAFIEGRLAQLVDTGCLDRQHGSGRLCATRAGRAHLTRLLRLEVDPGAASLWAFCTTLKLSLLDLVGADCRREVAATLLGAGRRRASSLEMARCAGCGPVMERCLALEQEREALELRWLQDAVASRGTGERIAEGIGETVA
jgi:Putative AphA-like transcriptional regulator